MTFWLAEHNLWLGTLTRPIIHQRYDAEIQHAAASTGVEFALLKAIVAAESGFDPRARRYEAKYDQWSIGLTQVLLRTARGLGYAGDEGSYMELTGLYEPAVNLLYGAKNLAGLIRLLGGDPWRAVSAYNGGIRPKLGFGSPATVPVHLCLARATDGGCLKSHTAKVGEFGNQPYVDRVLDAYLHFGGRQAGA